MDTLLEVVEAARTANSGCHRIARVKVIARNKAVSPLRRRNALNRGGGHTTSREGLTPDGGDPPGGAEEITPLDALSERELAALLERLLMKLPPQMRQLLREHYVEELAYEEIARRHGWEVGTVGANLGRAKRALLKALVLLRKNSESIRDSYDG